MNRLKKKKSKQCCNKFDIEINKNISNKFKNILGSNNYCFNKLFNAKRYIK